MREDSVTKATAYTGDAEQLDIVANQIREDGKKHIIRELRNSLVQVA
jgi:hypothetical protein